MKIQTTRNNILNALLFANRAINPKTTSFILSGVMLEADESFSIYSTDLETSVKNTIKAKVLEKGKTVVPAKILINILRSLKEAKIELDFNSETNTLKIEYQNTGFTLNTLSVTEYPAFPDIKEENKLSMEINKFKNMVSKVQRAAAIDESRAVLTGILLEVEKDNLRMVATDSYRLALAEEKIKNSGSAAKVVVPARVLDSIQKSEYSEETVEMNIEENQISFNIKKENEVKDIIISRLLSGKFPQYSQLMPTDLKHNILIDKEKILEVVKRISSISKENIPIKFSIDKGKITVNMNIKEVGSSSEDFEVSYGEEKIDIAFNPDYLIDGINMMDSKKIILSIEEPLKPILVKPGENENMLYLLMPVRVS